MVGWGPSGQTLAVAVAVAAERVAGGSGEGWVEEGVLGGRREKGLECWGLTLAPQLSLVDPGLL